MGCKTRVESVGFLFGGTALHCGAGLGLYVGVQ